MHRGSALALAAEKWHRAGLWVLTRADHDYPRRLKKLLKTDCPPVLFGAGDPGLLNKGGVAVVGARNADNSALAFSHALGGKAAEQGYLIISGGARGVDEAAMTGSLEAEGAVIGVMADSLLKAAMSKKYRQHLVNNNLVLISSYYPEAGFNAGNAMSRNKYIYCIADMAVVVQSGTRGGTWSGVLENLKNNWTPLWVRETDDKKSGNALIISKGGQCLSKELRQLDIGALFDHRHAMNDSPVTQDIFGKVAVREDSGQYETHETATEDNNKKTHNEAIKNISLYQCFLIKLRALINETAKTTDELVGELELNKTQLNTWLKQAVKDKKIKKLNRPVRYEWQGIDK